MATARSASQAASRSAGTSSGNWDSTTASIIGPDLRAALRAACPSGIDVYFENVGGAVLDAAWPLLNDFARVAVCGLVAQYNDSERRPGPPLDSVLRKRLTVKGFIISDHSARIDEMTRALAGWVRERQLKYREDIIEGGLERAPEAFIGLLQGRNFGKLIVHVG